MNTAGTIAFCTLASVIIVIAAIQCYRIWQQDKTLTKRRMNDASGHDAEIAGRTTDLGTVGVEGPLTVHGDVQGGSQVGGALNLNPSPARNAYPGTRPGSGYDGLEVVPSTPDMVQRKDFAITASTPQVRQRPGGSSWTEYANSITNFDHGQGQTMVSELSLHQAPATQHQSQSLLQPSGIALPSRSPSPVSALQGPAQFLLGRSMQHQGQGTEGSGSIHSIHSSVEVASPPSVVYRPYKPQADQDIHLRALSKSPETIGGRASAQEGSSTIQELESPLHASSNCSTPPPNDTQPPHRPVSAAQVHTRHLSTESHRYGAHQIGAWGSKESQLHSRPTAPVHSHSASLPATGRQVTEPSQRVGNQPHQGHQKPGRFSLNALTTALPKRNRWSWNPQDDAAFSRKVREGDAS